MILGRKKRCQERFALVRALLPPIESFIAMAGITYEDGKPGVTDDPHQQRAAEAVRTLRQIADKEVSRGD